MIVKFTICNLHPYFDSENNDGVNLSIDETLLVHHRYPFSISQLFTIELAGDSSHGL